MIKKRIIFILAISLILVSNILVLFPDKTFAYPNTEAQFDSYVQSLGYSVTTPNGKKANWSTYQTYNEIVWGNPNGRYKTGSLCGHSNEYEYLGYNYTGNKDITNKCFPNDASSGTDPSTWNYIYLGSSSTWQKPITTPEQAQHILHSKLSGNGTTSLTIAQIGGENYAKVELAPTWLSKGSILTENKGASSGKIYYATFTVPPMAGSSPVVDGNFSTDKNTYTIGPDQNSVTVHYGIKAQALIKGYMNYNEVKSLTADYKGKTHTTSGQEYSELDSPLTLSRNDFGVGTHTLTLTGTVSITSVFGDTQTKKVMKTITLNVQSPAAKTVNDSATTSPSSKTFNSPSDVSDVSVMVDVKGTLKGISDTSQIDHWVLEAKKKQDSTYLTKTITSQSLSETHGFTFTIPKSDIGSSDYAQDFQTQAKVFLKNGDSLVGKADAVTNISVGSPPPPPPNPVPANKPPTAKIYGPNVVKKGDVFCLSGGASDPDGTIASTRWSTPGASQSISGTFGCTYYMNEGNYNTTFTATDNDGASATAYHPITVIKPTPVASFQVGGSLKQNRKVTITNSSSSPTYFPIDWSKSYYKITAQDSVNQSAIKYVGSLTDQQNVDALFKQPGKYTISLHVVNTVGFSDDASRTITIAPDQPPIADFSTVTTIYRDPNNNNQATIKLTDKSYSPDSDIIGQRIWTYTFDSQNDGTFSDDNPVVINSANEQTLSFNVNHVGKYKIEEKVVEQFGQPTISQFITSNDYKTGDTSSKPIAEKVVDVKNLSPYVSFGVAPKTTVDLNFGIGDTAYNNQTTLKSEINSIVVPKLNNYGIKINSINISNVTINNYTPTGNVEFRPLSSSGTRWSTNYPNLSIPNGYVPLGVTSNGSYHTEFIVNPTTGNVEFRSLSSSGTRWGTNYPNLPIPNGYVPLGVTSGSTEFIVNPTTGNVEFRSLSSSGTRWGTNYPNLPIPNGYVPLGVTSGSYNVEFIVNPTTGNVEFRPLSSSGTRWSTNYPDLPIPNGYSKLGATHGSEEYIVQSKRLSSVSFPTANSNNSTFTSILEDTSLSSAGKTKLEAYALSNKAHLVGMGTSSNQSDFQDIINQNMGKGEFINNTSGLNSTLNALADYIIKELATNYKYVTYMTEDQTANYPTIYSDAEKDPKYQEHWLYNQDPNVFENSQGTASFNNSNLSSPVTHFSKVGLYQVTYSARDNPVGTDNRFDNYRLWSNKESNYYIYVNRKPIANFDFSINSSTGNYSITNKAYDLDKQSLDIGYGGGIQSMSYQWKLQNSSTWNNGLPPNPLSRSIYDVKQTVTDFQGATSTITKTLNATGVNAPPIAAFNFNPGSEVSDNINVGANDQSYDPNGDPLTHSWTITSPSGVVQTSSSVNIPSTTYSPGNWAFTEKVTDSYGASDSVTKVLTVTQPNQAPTAGYNVNTPLYVGDTMKITSTASDPDGDALTYKYVLTKPNGVSLTYKTGDPQIDSNGNLTIPTKSGDQGVWQITQYVSDNKTTPASVSGTILVNDLSILGFVQHTPNWKSIHENNGQPLSDFYSGEQFILKANVTPIPITKVIAVLNGTSIDGSPIALSTQLIKNTASEYDGTLNNNILIDPTTRLQNGSAKFTFTVYYANGTIRTDIEYIQILGSFYQVLKLHRTF